VAKREFAAKMVRIHLSESHKWQGKPVREAILAKCRKLGVDQVTVYRGLERFGSSARVRHARG
jgi:PII-like signaling protein